MLRPFSLVTLMVTYADGTVLVKNIQYARSWLFSRFGTQPEGICRSEHVTNTYRILEDDDNVDRTGNVEVKRILQVGRLYDFVIRPSTMLLPPPRRRTARRKMQTRRQVTKCLFVSIAGCRRMVVTGYFISEPVLLLLKNREDNYTSKNKNDNDSS